LDARTIARPAALDLAGIHRRPREVGADKPMHLFVRVGDVAVKLRLSDALGRKAERPRVGVTGLPFALCEVDGTAVEPARRAGLEAGELKAAGGEAVAERFGGPVAGAAAARLGLAHVHQRFEKRPRCEDDGAGAVACVSADLDSHNAVRGYRG